MSVSFEEAIFIGHLATSGQKRPLKFQLLIQKTISESNLTRI